MPFGVEQRKPSVTVNAPVIFNLGGIEHDASGAMATARPIRAQDPSPPGGMGRRSMPTTTRHKARP
jgi:hypothetical protein